MPKALEDISEKVRAGSMYLLPLTGFGLGLAWGGAGGAIVGFGVCLSMDLFFSSAYAMALIVVFITMILGALVGQAMASLLEDEAAILSGDTKPLAAERVTKTVNITEFRPEKENKSYIYQNDKRSSISRDSAFLMSSTSVRGTPINSSSPDPRVFALIVDKAQKLGINVAG